MRCGCVALMGLNHVLRRFVCLVCGICQSTCIVRFVSANKVSSRFQMHPAQAAESAAVSSLGLRQHAGVFQLRWHIGSVSASLPHSISALLLELLSVAQPHAPPDEVPGRSTCYHLS